jgi:hypothetical protein
MISIRMLSVSVLYDYHAGRRIDELQARTLGIGPRRRRRKVLNWRCEGRQQQFSMTRSLSCSIEDMESAADIRAPGMWRSYNGSTASARNPSEVATITLGASPSMVSRLGLNTTVRLPAMA